MLNFKQPLMPRPRRHGAGRRPTIRSASCLLLLFSTSCASPPVVSGDLSCERFRHISATPFQIDIISKNYEALETFAEQVAAHNVEYDRACLEPEKGGK